MTTQPQSRVQVGTTANFKELVLAGERPVVVDFWAPWCSWCKKLAPIFDAVSATFDELKFVKVNVDEQRELAAQYAISSLPTLKFFCGGREIDQMVGSLPKEKLEARFREIIARHKECLSSSSPAGPK